MDVTALRRPYRILALDGGGVRCIMQLAILRELEKAAGPLHECFDAIVGTSVGSLIGCSISMGQGIEDGLETFYSFADDVFSRNTTLAQKARRLAFWSFSKHSDATVIRVLKSIYGDLRMKDLKVNPTVVVCYNAATSKPELISSDCDKYGDVPVWQACKATTSAPLYFKPQQVDLRYYAQPLLDGGLASNNPSLFGLVKAFEGLRQRDEDANVSNVVLVSLGSGKVRESPKTDLLSHINSLASLPFFGTSEASHHILRCLMGSNYFRFQVEIPSALKRPDRSKNLGRLHAIAEDVIDEQFRPAIDELAGLLRPTHDHGAPAAGRMSSSGRSNVVRTLRPRSGTSSDSVNNS